MNSAFVNGLIRFLVDLLFEKEHRHLTQVKENLIEANQALGNSKDGFLYKGAFHTSLPYSQRFSAEKKMLHPDLYERGDHYVDTMELLEKDRLRIEQMFSLLFSSCRTKQEIRDAVPEIIADLLPADIRELTRTREEGWPLSSKPLQLPQYEQTVELITLYVANRMLY